MEADRETRRRDERRRDPERRRPDRHDRAAGGSARRSAEPPPRTRPAPRAKAADARETRPVRSGPPTTPVRRQARPTSTTQAKARAKARKAKAPKAIRTPLRERLVARLASVDLRPRTLAAKVPFVVLVIGSLGLGLGATLWLSTYSAERSYELGNARETKRVLTQQKEALERDVLEAQSAPALAEAARNLGMIPSRDTAHLVQDPSGNWIVVGKPKPAEGAPPPPLNTPLPDPAPPPPPVNRTEVLVRVPAPATALAAPAAPGAATPAAPGATPPVPAGPEVLVRMPSPDAAAAPPPPAPPPPPPPPPAPPPPPPPRPRHPRRPTRRNQQIPRLRPRAENNPTPWRPRQPVRRREPRRSFPGCPGATRAARSIGHARRGPGDAGAVRRTLGARPSHPPDRRGQGPGGVVRRAVPNRQRRHLPVADRGDRAVVQPAGAQGRRPARRGCGPAPGHRHREGGAGQHRRPQREQARVHDPGSRPDLPAGQDPQAAGRRAAKEA